MAAYSHHASHQTARAGRRGARAVVASGATLLPLLAVTFATLETAILFAGENLLRVLGFAH